MRKGEREYCSQRKIFDARSLQLNILTCRPTANIPVDNISLQVTPFRSVVSKLAKAYHTLMGIFEGSSNF